MHDHPLATRHRNPAWRTPWLALKRRLCAWLGTENSTAPDSPTPSAHPAQASAQTAGNACPPETLVLRSLITALLADRHAERRSRLVRAMLYFAMFAAPALLWASFYAYGAGLRFGPAGEVVGVVRLHGEMASGNAASADRVIPLLREAFKSEHVRAVVLSVDSPGGSPVEAERIYTAVQGLKKAHPKPVVSVIHNQGTSAAYLVALHTDRIYAGRYSLVGSVGAILSGWDTHQALQRLGLSHRVYASGELKSMMNPFVAMTPQAERQARVLVEQLGHAFVAELKQERHGLLAQDVDFGAGGVWSGAEAQRIGLVDGLKTIEQLIQDTWLDLEVHQFGPRTPGLPFAGASGVWASWLADALQSLAGTVRVQ